MKFTELFGAAKWVTPSGKCDTPYIRGEFSLKKEIQSTRITVCGLGWFELYINGSKVSDDLFTPANTDYHPCAEQPCLVLYQEVLSHRIYCLQYDVTSYLRKENCIGIALAPGWYQYEGEDHSYGLEFSYGRIKACYRMEITYTDGSKEERLSGDSLRWTQSPIVSYHLRYGETQDYHTYTLDGWSEPGYEGDNWELVEIAEVPGTECYIQDFPSDRIIRHIKPRLLYETEEGYVYDCGENITGTPIIRAKGKAGDPIFLCCSERLNPDGTIEEYTQHNQRSVFIPDGTDRLYQLRFTWYGFRYAMVSKHAEIVDCAVIHTDLSVTSRFHSDNEILNWLYETYIRTQLDNIHGCIPSDCPHLERQGYTGDGQLTAECCMMLLGARRMYDKWMQDIADCQDTVSGHVQYCAPYLRCGGGPGGWGCAIIEVPYTYYKIYGDKKVLEEFLPKALHYFSYLDEHSEEELVTSDQPGLWCLGDWCTPEDIAIPAPFVNTYFYIKSLGRAIEACKILEKEALIPELEQKKEVKCQALLKHYYDASTGDFAGNVQGANAFGLHLGLGDERTLEHMVERYREYGMYDTGIFGTDLVTRVLFEKGYGQEAYELMTSKGKYSFYNWMVSGSTTLPEYWTFRRSQNHPMFGAVVKYLFIHLLGIQNVDAAYEKIRIAPQFVEGLDQAEGEILTEQGRIAVKIVKSRDAIEIEVEIPQHTNAEFLYNGELRMLQAGWNRLRLNRI